MTKLGARSGHIRIAAQAAEIWRKSSFAFANSAGVSRTRSQLSNKLVPQPNQENDCNVKQTTKIN
jgi:hypothetical protein